MAMFATSPGPLTPLARWYGNKQIQVEISE